MYDYASILISQIHEIYYLIFIIRMKLIFNIYLLYRLRMYICRNSNADMKSANMDIVFYLVENDFGSYMYCKSITVYFETCTKSYLR